MLARDLTVEWGLTLEWGMSTVLAWKRLWVRVRVGVMCCLLLHID